MPLELTLPTPLSYFAALVQQDESLPLLEAAASLAQDETPELDVQQVLEQLDHLTARLARRLDMLLDAGAMDEARAALEHCDDDGAPGWSGIGCADPTVASIRSVNTMLSTTSINPLVKPVAS